jgi:hypothetical protein
VRRKTYHNGRKCKVCGKPVADQMPRINNGDYHRRCVNKAPAAGGEGGGE